MASDGVGAWRHRITIQQPTETQDSYGAAVVTWSTYAVRWGSVSPLAGRELFFARQIRPDVTHKVELWYVSGLTVRMRIQHRGRWLNIESIIDRDERHAVHELLCRESL